MANSPYLRIGLKVALLGLALMPLSLFADAPAVINYQGKLADSSGNPQTGNFPMVFSLYANPTGGAALFSDDRTAVGQEVPVSNGLFNVLIGAGSTLSGNLTTALQGNAVRYLQVTVSGTDLLPRQRLVASPYALAVAQGAISDSEVSSSAGISATKLSAGTFPSGNYSFSGSTVTVSSMVVTGLINMNNRAIQNLPTTPANANDAASKSYVDNATGTVSGNLVKKTGDAMTGQLTVQSTVTVIGSSFSVGTSTFAITGGKVGIGTSSPGAMLTVGSNLGTSNGEIILARSTGAPNRAFKMGLDVNYSYSIGDYANGAGPFTPFMTIGYEGSPYSGNVGIGTTTPGYKLHVYDSTSPSNSQIMVGSGISGLTLTNVGVMIGAANGWIPRLSIGTSSSYYTQYGWRGDLNKAELNSTTDILLLPTGNVGIGTTNPIRGLELASNNGLGITDTFPFINFKETDNSNKSWFIVGNNNNLMINEDTTSSGDAKVTFEAGGNVGIGVADPIAILDIGVGALHLSGQCGGTVANKQGTYLSWNMLACGSGATEFINHKGGGAGGFNFVNTANGSAFTNLMNVDQNGNLTVGTGSLGCVSDRDGTLIAGSCASDNRLKHDIISLTPMLDKLAQLRPVSFTWNKTGSHDYGLIAQEVESVFPDMVTANQDGFKTVRYDVSFQMRLLQGIKEQQAIINNLKAEITALKTSLEELKKK